jgi:hypothetical protein
MFRAHGKPRGHYDDVAGVPITVDHAHAHVHEGASFTVTFSNTTANNNNHRSVVGFKTPDTTRWFHIVATVSCSTPAEVYLREAPAIDDGAGTEEVAYNRNRNSATAPTVLSLEAVPTVGSVTTFTEAQIAAANFSGGTELARATLQEGAGGQAVGGVARGSQEWVLKQNTKYVIVIQNTTTATNKHIIRLDWYEHTSL